MNESNSCVDTDLVSAMPDTNSDHVLLIPFDPDAFEAEQFLFGTESDIASIFWSVVEGLNKHTSMRCSMAPFSFGDFSAVDPKKRWAWTIVDINSKDKPSASFLVTAIEKQGKRLLTFADRDGAILAGEIALAPNAARVFRDLVDSALLQFGEKKVL